jgi:hypothetical protein
MNNLNPIEVKFILQAFAPSFRPFESDKNYPRIEKVLSWFLAGLHIHKKCIPESDATRYYQLFTTSDLKQVITKLGFNRPLQRGDISTEYNFIEFLYHHTRTELTQITTLRFRWAIGMRLRNCGEILSLIDTVFEFKAFFFAIN